MVSLSNKEELCFSFETETETERDDDYIHLLFIREKPLSSLASTEEWTQCARLESIAWIMKSRAILEFQFQTAYLSVTYLDQFLSRRSINRGNGWAIRLLSVACLRMAAKMEECTVPLLPDFFGTEQSDEYNFDSNVVQRMELLVLSTLEWNMRLVTPFAYINCFIAKCCGDQSIRRSMISRFVQIIMASMRDVNLMSHRPSVIALAATLVALDSKMTMPELELKIIAHSPFPSGFLKLADVVSCYNRMKELSNTENITQLQGVVSPNLPRVEWGEKKCFESYVISGLSNKRKRLVYRECDKEYDISNEKRLL